VAKVIDCAKAGERDLALLYLAGRLPEDEAEAFEAHYFECENCWHDVQRGSELRAALGKPAVAPLAAATRSAWDWRPFAAAAVIAFVGLGVWQLTRRTAEEPNRPVLRGVNAEGLALKVETGPQGGINLTWPPHPDAATYEVEVVASDGVSVWKKETKEPRVTIGAAVLPAPREGISFVVKVEALDSMRQVVATSELTPLPQP
jgi:anti-sigma factor RsiW